MIAVTRCAGVTSKAGCSASTPAREVFTVAVDETVAVACTRMKEQGVSQLPVVDNGQLAGIISETDVLARIVGGRASLESTVAEAMIREVETVHLDDDATQLTKVFADGFIGIVVDDQNKLHGVVTQLDLVDFLTTHVE